MTVRPSEREFANLNRRTARSADAVDAIMSWCDALGGVASQQSALTDLVSGLGAECGAIVRTQMNDARPVRIAQCDLVRTAHSCQLRRSFADSYFGPLLAKARPATIWQATAHADEATGDRALAEWQSARGMKEFLVLILANGPQTRDHVELHFRQSLPPGIKQSIAAALPDMARMWATHRAGSVARTAAVHGRTDPDRFHGLANPHILDADNPQRLSRAEFRVCLSLSKGLMIPAVSQELGLSATTIRTHLRNIYAKTGCNSPDELVFRLSDHQPQPETRYSKTA